MGTDSDWEKWGASAPYFGVLSEDRFRAENLRASDREEFFRTGEQHVASVFDTIERYVAPGFSPGGVLDFGCGIGRLAIPFARRAPQATGVDVSQSMLKAAARRCEEVGAGNVHLICSGDLEDMIGSHDLVHSYIVLQHIPWERGRQLVQRLAGLVSPNDGVIALQILTSCNAAPLRRSLAKLRYAIPPINWLRNMLARRPLLEPVMQMHVYDVAAMRRDLATLGFGTCVEIPDAGVADFSSVFLFARRDQPVAGHSAEEELPTSDLHARQPAGASA